VRSAPHPTADTSEISANMSGDVILEFTEKDDGNPAVILRITGCMYVEDLGYNLIAVGKLADKGITLIFRAETVELKIEAETHILGKRIRDREDASLYVLPSPKQYEHTLVFIFQPARRMTLEPGTKEWQTRISMTCAKHASIVMFLFFF
jgi:hypothetical protein